MAGTRRGIHTGLLLLQGQLLPVSLHAVPQRHPQIGLLLGRHVLPSLLDVGECRVGNGMCLAGLLLETDCGGDAGSADGLMGRRGRRENRGRAPSSPDKGGAHHGGG